MRLSCPNSGVLSSQWQTHKISWSKIVTFLKDLEGHDGHILVFATLDILSSNKKFREMPVYAFRILSHGLRNHPDYEDMKLVLNIIQLAGTQRPDGERTMSIAQDLIEMRDLKCKDEER